MSIGREKQVWISFKYERLPNICYWCGCFDHDDKDCEIWLNSEGSLPQEQRQFVPSLRAPPFSYSRKQVLTVPGFYKSRPNHAPSSMNKDSDGNKGDREGKDNNKTQVEVPSSPPLSNREPGEDTQKRNKPATMGKSQNLMQSVTCTNCPTEVTPTCPQSVVRNYVPPISTHNTDLHLQEIGIALNDFDPIKNPTQNGNSTGLPFPNSSLNTSVEIFTTIPAPKGNISGAYTQEFNQKLIPDLIPHGTLNVARDSQSARAPTVASKPRWTRVCRATTSPSEDVSKGTLNHGKRPFPTSDEHSKLPNKRCQVSRSEADDCIELAEVNIQPHQSP